MKSPATTVLTVLGIALAMPVVALAAGGISGHVQDRDTEAPLACEVNVETTDGEWVASAWCDVAGDYVFQDLPPGDYHARAEIPVPEDWDPATLLHCAQYYPDTIFYDEAESITVVDGQVTGGIDFDLYLGTTVSGTIRAADTSEPVAGIDVYIYEPEWRTSFNAPSGEDGTYAVPAIPPGTYLAATYTETGPWMNMYWPDAVFEQDAMPLGITVPELMEGIDFDLLREAVITGHVYRASDHSPVADAFVEAHVPDWSFSNWATTAVDGSFRIGRLAPTTYRVWADAENLGEAYYVDDEGRPVDIPLTAGQEVGGVVIELAEGGAVSGLVLRAADSSPVAYGYVYAWRPADEMGFGTDTGEDGQFRFDALPAGVYHLMAEGDQGENLIPQTYSDSEGNPIPVEVEVGGEVAGIVFELPEGGLVTGTVLAQDDGEPIAGAYVAAIQADGQGQRDTTSGEDGTYRIAGLEAADHLVMAIHPDYLQQAYDGQLLPWNGTPVPVEIGETTTGIDFHLERAGKISGTVRSAENGEPLEEVFIGVFLNEDVWLDGAYTVTGPDGSYVIGSVPAGEPVYLLAYDWREEYAWSWYQNVFTFEEATPVEVLVDQVTEGIDFDLLRPGRAEIAPQSLAFTGMTYQEDIPPQTLTVTNLGPGPVGVDAWTDVDWMWTEYDWENTILDAGEQLVIEVWVWTWGMSPGTYNDFVRVYDTITWTEQLIPVTLTLVESPPLLELEPDELWFDAELDGEDPAPDWIWLANLGGGSIAFTATADMPWISVAPAEGTLERGDDATQIEVSLTTAGLAEGEHHGTITVSSATGDRQVEVYLYVAPAPDGESDLDVQQQVTMVVPPNPKIRQDQATTTFWVDNDGDGTLYWTVRGVDQWVHLEPTSGEIPPAGGPVDISLTVDLENLPDGMNSTFVEVASAQETAWVEVGVQLGGETDASGGVTADTRGHLMIPVVVHAAGVGDSEFVSDVWVAHLPSGRSAEATLAFIPEGEDGTETAVVTDLVFESGQTIALLDVVANWLGGAISKGSLVIQSDFINEFEVMSRTYNLALGEGGKDDGGFVATYGQDIPGSSSDAGLGRLEGCLYVVGLEKSAAFRSNLLLTEVGGESAEVEVTLLDRTGETLGTTERSVGAFSTSQINDVFAAVGFEGSADGVLAVVEVTEGEGRVTAIGSVVDNATNDPTTLFGVPKDATVASSVVPVVAHAAGVAETQWVSDLHIANVDSSARQVTVTYHDRWGVEVGSHDYTIAARSTLTLRDVVATTFGLDSSRGSLTIVPEPVGGLAITSRTYNNGPQGTFGQGMAGAPSSTALAAGSQLLRLIALQNTDRYRTNLGLTEIAGEDVVVGVTLLDKDGELLGYNEIEVAAHGQFQANVFDSMGLGTSNVVAATAIIQVMSGEGSVMTYGSTVDNRTGDGTTLPPPTRVEEGDITMPAPPRP